MANNEQSVEDAFDAIMQEQGYSSEPQNASGGVQSKDTDSDANANTNDDDIVVVDNTNVATDQDSTDATPDNQEPDWKSEATRWEQKFKSFEGRMNNELARRKEEENLRQQQYLEALAKAGGSSTQQADDKTKQMSKFNQLREDYPEFADAVEELLQTKLAETRDVVKKEISSRVDPIISTMSSQQITSHERAILAKHPDAQEIHKSEKFASWVNNLPAFARSGAVYVINSGSADEVVSLLDQYKSSTNTKNQTNDTAKPTNDKNNTNAVSPEVAAALRSGLVVRTPRSADPATNQKTSDKNDFDSAWDEAVKQFGIK
jgi:hypothetical protein